MAHREFRGRRRQAVGSHEGVRRKCPASSELTDETGAAEYGATIIPQLDQLTLSAHRDTPLVAQRPRFNTAAAFSESPGTVVVREPTLQTGCRESCGAHAHRIDDARGRQPGHRLPEASNTTLMITGWRGRAEPAFHTQVMSWHVIDRCNLTILRAGERPLRPSSPGEPGGSWRSPLQAGNESWTPGTGVVMSRSDALVVF